MRERLAPYKGLVVLVLGFLYLTIGSAVRALGGPTWLVLTVTFGIYYYLYPAQPKKK